MRIERSGEAAAPKATSAPPASAPELLARLFPGNGHAMVVTDARGEGDEAILKITDPAAA